jgi:Flp pilus assembly protein TadD
MSDVAVLLQSAREALARGEHGQALPLLQEAVRLAPGNFEVHMYLGVYLGMAGQHVEGLRELNRAAELKPDSAHVRYNLGITLKLAGRLEEAAQPCKRFTQQNSLRLSECRGGCGSGRSTGSSSCSPCT